MAIFDDQLISRFRKRPEDAASTPPIYMTFDCLYLEGRDLRPLTLRERRAELERTLENDYALLFPARRAYEDLVGKDESAPYRGGRPLAWLKVRQRD